MDSPLRPATDIRPPPDAAPIHATARLVFSAVGLSRIASSSLTSITSFTAAARSRRHSSFVSHPGHWLPALPSRSPKNHLRPVGRDAGCSEVSRVSLLLHVEPELHHVAVLHDVFLALDPQLAGFAGLGVGAEADEVVEVDGLGRDEAALEIAVDDAGGGGRFVAGADGPGAGLLLAGGEVGAQAEQVIDGADERADAARWPRRCRRDIRRLPRR